MKKVISFILVLCLICCNGLVSFAADVSEAKITSPSNGEWIDPYKTTTIKWTTPSSELDYRVTIKNERTGKYIVQNEKVSGSSYSIKSNVLDFDERYVIWIGTYDGSTSVGRGDSITISVNDRNSSQKVYQEADFSYPSNNQEISADKDLKIILNGNSDLAYNLTVKDTTSEKTIVNESGLTKTSYTIKSSLLTEGHSYKAWVGTYKKASVEKKQFGAGKSVEFKTEKAAVNEPPQRPVVDTTGGSNKPERPVVDTGSTSTKNYEAAEITSPSDKEWLDPTNKITIKWGDVSEDLEYCLTVKDDVSGEYIVNNEYTSNSSYSIKSNTLTAEHRYKISLSTYADDTLVGSDEIYINMNEVDYEEADFSSPLEEKEIESATVEAVFSSPENNDIVNYKKDLTIKWKKSDVDTCFELTIKDTTDNSFIVKNEIVSATSYKIKSSKLKAKHQYKAWIGTYNNSSNDKKLIGKGDEIYFSTDGTIPVLVKSLNAELEDKGLVFKYEFTGDDFGYATVVVADAKGKTLYNDKVYDLNGEIIIESGKLEENYTYICEIQTYSSNGEKAAYKSQKYTVAKSGFSVMGVTKPTGELTYKKGFTVKGVVGSAYPIMEAKIAVFKKGNENDIIDIVHLKNYNQTAKNPTQFNIKDYDSEVNFGILTPGEYTYKVTVVDTMGNNYTAVESNFSVVREKGTYDDVSSDHKNYEAIKQLSLDGILAGDGTGIFRPNASITRAEFVKMLYFAFNLTPVSTRDLRSTFFDVDTSHWAYTYIMSAFNKNIISGKGNNKFAPSDNVTFEEAAKMLVCIKGWGDTAEQNGGWSGGGYITVANKNNFFTSTSVSNGNYKRNASRADVAQMFYNALNKNTNDVVKADKIYTVNGIKLYAYKYTSGYYVDTSKALPAFGGYDNKSENNRLKGEIQIWDVNIATGGKSLKVAYDFTGKHNGYYQQLNIQLTQNNLSLEYSIYKKYFKKNKIQLTCKDNMTLINVDDLAMLTNHMIKDGEFLPDDSRNIRLVGDVYYSNDSTVQNAQILYNIIEELGGQNRLNQSISLYDEWYNGALEAYEKSNDINKVYNAVGYLTTTTITVGSICVGNVAGVGQVAGAVAPGITLDVAANRIEEVCDTEQGVVCFLLANTDKDTYKKFADYHTSINRDTMTKEQAIEYITKYYEAAINAETITMAFSYFANKCPKNFPQALLGSAKAAFGSIISSGLGSIFGVSDTAQMSYDMANFLFGTSLSLLDTLKACDNEIVSDWANSVLNLNNDLNEDLYGGK